MKKIILTLLGLTLSLLLTGCGREPNKAFLVSAICFKNENEKIVATAEYISVSDTDAESGYTAKTVSVKADGVAAAVSRLTAEKAKTLMFEHCAVVMLSENLTAKQTNEVFEFLENGSISFSAMLVCVDGGEVLKAKTDSNPSVGYSLASYLKSRGENFGYGTHIKMYEISTARKQEQNIFALPFVTLKENSLSADGLMLYTDDVPKLKLDSKNSIFYAMARNVYEGGRIEVNGSVETLKTTKLKLVEKKNESLTFKINIQNNEILKEFERFSNEMLKNGINLLEGKDTEKIIIKGEED